MTRRPFVSTLAACALALSWVVVGDGAAHAAAPVPETAAEAYADLMAVQTATRSGWVSGYVMQWSVSAEGGETLIETFDAAHQTLLYRPSRGDFFLFTSKTEYRSIVRNTRTRAVLALAGRPAAVWGAATFANNPGFRLSLGHDFEFFATADPDPSTVGPRQVVESATVSTDVDGTRHWVVQSHQWSSGHIIASPDLLVTADPQGRLTALTSVGSPDGETVSYSPPSVPRPTAQQYILWNIYDLADSAYSLRSRVVGATSLIVSAAKRLATSHHRSLTVADVRYEAPKVVAALAGSPVPVRWTTVTSGVKVYGWNQFSRTWVIYLVRVVNRLAVVTRIS